MRVRSVLPGLLLAAVLAAAHPQASLAQTGPVGEVAFENSGKAAAQPAFRRGLAQLHNFEYQAAIEAFREAQAADPDFVMAYWGEAMAQNHPVWMEQDAAAARAALAKLASTREARRAKAGTERERAYLDAVEALYGEGAKEDRDRAYSAAMAEVHRRFPADVDARALYALSLLGLAHEGRDVTLYMRAAALLEEVFPQNQRHPGVLHYLIHSYDDPDHAPLGMRAARLYADVAGDAGHAVHMTSHIFLATGLWEDTVAMNARAMAVVNRQRAARGMGPTSCGHYAEWLVYGELQRGRVAEADAVINACAVEARAELARGVTEQRRSAVRSWADMAVRRVIETGAWPSDRVETPTRDYFQSRLAIAYAEALTAKDGEAAARARETLQDLIEVAPTGEGHAALGRFEVLAAQAAGMEALRQGQAEAGLAELKAAAEKESSLPVEFGPPAIEKPGWELYGDELLRLGRKAEARAAYERALAAAPGRRLSLAGRDASR